VEAVLTMPRHRADATKLPLIVLPHGGPWARDSEDWGVCSLGAAARRDGLRGCPAQFPRLVGLWSRMGGSVRWQLGAPHAGRPQRRGCASGAAGHRRSGTGVHDGVVLRRICRLPRRAA
jgi:hypothetical protein